MKRILILEDNVKTLTSLEKMIREISPEIITFPVQTYEEACICAVKQQIDIFILDIILNTKQPGDTSGMAFAREMRNYKKYQLTPMIRNCMRIENCIVSDISRSHFQWKTRESW